MASTSVVLPWSTCAMMAMLRIDGLLVFMGCDWGARTDACRVHTRVNALSNWQYCYARGEPFSANAGMFTLGIFDALSAETHYNSLVLDSDFSHGNFARRRMGVHTIVNAARMSACATICLKHCCNSLSSYSTVVIALLKFITWMVQSRVSEWYVAIRASAHGRRCKSQAMGPRH